MRAPYGARFAFEDDADEELWAMRDYFCALRLGLIGHENTPANYHAFRRGYADHGIFDRQTRNLTLMRVK